MAIYFTGCFITLLILLLIALSALAWELMGEDTDIIDIIIRTGGIALIVLFSWVSIVVIAVFFGLKRKDKDETI